MRKVGVRVVAQWKQIQLVSMRTKVLSLALLSGLRIWCCCKLWWRPQTRLGSHVVVVWLWHWLTAAAPIQPPAWELPFATCAALKREKKKKWGKLYQENVKYSTILLILRMQEFSCDAASCHCNGLDHDSSWVTAVVWVWSLAREFLYVMGMAKKTEGSKYNKKE